MIQNKIPGLPIVYESKKVEKSIVDSRDDKTQVEGQLLGHNSKVGFATNISSALYCLLEEFPKGTKEHDAILQRLKIGRAIQGEIIDGVKGLKVPPFRNHWTKHKRIIPSMSADEVKKWTLYNKIVCRVRPSFFRFLYPHYMSRYNKELKKYNIFAHLAFGTSFDEICRAKVLPIEQKELIESYKAYSYFLDNNSAVNRISRYMRANLGLIDRYSAKLSQEFDYGILQNKSHEINIYKLSQMEIYLSAYKAFKRGLHHDLAKSYENMDGFIAHLRKECAENISSNDSELADYAVEVTYGKEVSMVEFAWRMFPQGIIENIMENSSGVIEIPTQDEAGDISYLWNTYSMKSFSAEDYEN